MPRIGVRVDAFPQELLPKSSLGAASYHSVRRHLAGDIAPIFLAHQFTNFALARNTSKSATAEAAVRNTARWSQFDPQRLFKISGSGR